MYQAAFKDKPRDDKPTEEFTRSFNRSSEEYFDYICDPCRNVDRRAAEAQGYCTDCKEYLCGTCFECHSKHKLTKNHVLLKKEVMPKRCDPCRRGDEEKKAISYCKDCNEYLCDVCDKNHPKNKLSKDHTLVGLGNMSKESVKPNIDQNVSVNMKEYGYIRDINVKADKDLLKSCNITGMTLVSNTELILCDYLNICLKLVDIKTGSIKDVLIMQSEPSAITTISNDQDAVLIHLQSKCEIQIISVAGGLSVVRTVETKCKFVDLKFTNGKFYASCTDPVMFQILQPSGEIIKTINFEQDSEVLKRCSLPLHIAVSSGGSRIYVSDWETSSVFSMDMNGNMISVYKDRLLHPQDITVSSCGTVFLCDKNQHVVYKMTPDLKEGTVILGPEDILSFPYAICLSTDRQYLYISSGSEEAKYKNFIKVYQRK